MQIQGLSSIFEAETGSFSGTQPAHIKGRMKSNEVGKQTYFAGERTIFTKFGFLAMLLIAPLTGFADAQTSLSYFSIFYQNILEFSTCATMTINGPVHCNTNIDVGAGGAATLTFNNTVSAAGYVLAPPNNGATWGDATNYSSGWRTVFNGSPGIITNSPIIDTSLGTYDPHGLIDLPPAGEDPSGFPGAQRLYNQAQVVLTVSNLSSVSTNLVVALKIQQSPGPGEVPGADPFPVTITYTNPTPAFLSNNLPFLSLTNRFYDGRERKTNLTTQVDIGKYRLWLTNASSVTSKCPPTGANGYPTILYIADNRNINTNQHTVVRLTNGIAPPVNGGLGFSVATPNPLYVSGNYNCTNAASLGTTNTLGTVPCAFYSDALTVLSTNWSDARSLSSSYSMTWDASDITINSAILTGIVPSSGSDSMHFSGGVHNFVRLLENWGGARFTLNTSLINLYNSTQATGPFRDPGVYSSPPMRQYSHDPKFFNPSMTPPGMPSALVSSPLIFARSQTLIEPIDANNFSATVGAAGYGPVSFQWTFNGTNIDGATNNTLSLTNLRTRNTSGVYQITVSDAIATNTATILNLIVTNMPPIITQQPTNLSVLTGSNANFFAAARGNPPMFWQWQFNGTNIDGATNTTFILTNVGPDHAGSYSVVITNAYGSAVSSNAVLSVYTSAVSTMASPSFSPASQFQFTLVGVPGLKYTLQASTDLVNWDSILTNVVPFDFTDTNTVNWPHRYYRAVYLP